MFNRGVIPKIVEKKEQIACCILVIRLGAIGDCLRMLPAVRRLRRELPNAEIAWAVEHWAYPVLKNNPNIDRFHVLDRRAFSGGLRRAATEIRRFVTEVRVYKYDITIDFHGRFKSGLVSVLSGAKTRIGFAKGDSTEANHLFNNVYVRLEDRWENRVLRFLQLLEPLSIPTEHDPTDVGVYVPGEDLAQARTWHEKVGRPSLAIYPGTSQKRYRERWPMDKWKDLLHRLCKEGISSVLFWGPDEKDVVISLAESAGHSCTLAPATTLPQMMAMLSCFDVFLGSDTAAMHMAWLQGIPTAVLTSLKPTRTFAPLDPVPHRVLRARQYERENVFIHKQPPEVLTAIPVDEALEAVKHLLEIPRGSEAGCLSSSLCHSGNKLRL